MQLPVKPFLTTLLLAAAGPAAAQEQTQQEPWYQVDVILFKLIDADLDDESWPDFDPHYPADVTAITPPRVFNLSQLEQAAAAAVFNEATTDDDPATRFAFSARSNSATNRLIVESLIQADTVAAKTNDAVMNDSVGDTATNEAVPGEAGPESLQGDINSVPVATDPPAEDDSAAARGDSRLPTANPGAAGTLAFSRVDDASTLESILRSLRRSSRYAVLGSYSWIQPIDNKKTPIMIQAGDRYDDRFELEGILAFNRSRYLHVTTDLWYTVFENRGTGAAAQGADVIATLDAEMLSGYEDLTAVEQRRGQYAPARTHRMSQSRRMRSSEVHYLDHPLFGVIIRVNRYELPATAED